MAKQKYTRRADGRFAKQVTVGYNGKNPIKKTVYGRTEKELEKNYRDMMFYVDRNVILDSKTITLSELTDEWYRLRKEGKVRVNTDCSYKSIIKRIKAIGDMKVKDIKRYNIECLLSDIQKEGYNNTAKSVLKMLNKIFSYAIQNDLILKNPCADLSVRYTEKKKRILTQAEMDIIDKVDMPLRDKAFLSLLRYTGIRRGELFALNKSDIDKNLMIIHINKTVIDNNGEPYIQDTTKTPAGVRDIPIFLRLAKPLFAYMDTVDGDLFLNRNGKIMASNSMQHMFKTITEKYGFEKGLTMHCFRHNFVTECYRANVDIKKTQYWVGHDDIQTTLNIYTQLSKAELADGSCLDKYYGSQTEVKPLKKKKKSS